MKPKFILTADDYGPVEFINAGIRKLVKDGKINSVQVLTNWGDQSKLNKSLEVLANDVPPGKQLDIGLHLTVTSGQPLFLDSDKVITAWDKMITNKGTTAKPKWEFTSFKKFQVNYLDEVRDTPREYQTRRECVKREFKLQRDRLVAAIDHVNSAPGANRLKLTSLSCHHNILTASKEFFELYNEFSTADGFDLALRSPRILPKFKSWVFVNVVISMGKLPPGAKYEASVLQDSFINFEYPDKATDVRTSLYADMRHYKRSGKLGKKAGKQAKKATKRFGQMVDKTKGKTIRRFFRNHRNSTVEFIFHVGDPDADEADIKDSLVAHYSGIDIKYFDNRVIEARGLQLHSGRGEAFQNLASWDACTRIRFKKTPPK